MIERDPKFPDHARIVIPCDCVGGCTMLVIDRWDQDPGTDDSGPIYTYGLESHGEIVGDQVIERLVYPHPPDALIGPMLLPDDGFDHTLEVARSRESTAARRSAVRRAISGGRRRTLAERFRRTLFGRRTDRR